MTSEWFFDGWAALARILVVGALSYLAVVFILRPAGNRTLAKSAGYDHVVTVAFGSALATTLLSKQTSLATGVTAFAALVLLQFVLAVGVSRFRFIQRLLIHPPTVLAYDGRLLCEAIRQARVSEDDVHAALRKAGIGRLEEVGLVVLEADGEFSVVRRTELPANALAGIRDQLPKEASLPV